MIKPKGMASAVPFFLTLPQIFLLNHGVHGDTQ